jgi:hypothetical protein
MAALAAIMPEIGPLLRLALRSDMAGEQVAALRGVRRKLAKAQTDAHAFVDMIEAALARPSPQAVAATPPRKTTQRRKRKAARQTEQHRQAEHSGLIWVAAVDRLLAVGTEQLGPRNTDFLTNVRAAAVRGRPPSPKQRQWLRNLEKQFGERT